jgi:AcrR family transcriptional regulator
MTQRRNRSKAPRKRPRQQRSQALVEAILQATSHLLPERGAEQTTTNRIARVAGVSIGSLYQYFPNKDAILSRLIGRGLDQERDTLLSLVEQKRDLPLPELVDAVVDQLTDLYLDRSTLLRNLVVHTPRLEQLDSVVRTRTDVARFVADVLRERRSEIDPVDPDQAAFMLINAVMGVYQTWVLTEPVARLSKAELKRELRRLILGYLEGDGGGHPRGRPPAASKG